MDILFWSSCLVIVSVIVCCLGYWTSRSKLPPGPSAWHITLAFISCSKRFHRYADSLAYKYGPLVTVRVGYRPGILINDAVMIREALATEGANFADRWNTLTCIMISRNEQNIIFGRYMKEWQVQRKLAYKALHLFGEGMIRFESQIIFEVQKLSSILSIYESRAVDLSADLENSVFSFLCHVVFGHRYEEGDPELFKLKKSFHVITGYDAVFNFFSLFPKLYPLTYLFKPKWLKELEKEVRVRDQIFEENFAKIKDDFREGVVNNYTESLLQAAKDEERMTGNSSKHLSHDRLIMCMFDVFAAGTHTTAATLQWAILYMESWPDVQEKVYQEIEVLLGKPSETVYVRLNHRKSLPYTEAALKEVLRLSSIAFNGLPHMTTKDVSFHGYRIAKGTGILFNLYHIHHNEKYFPEPYNFIPERFIDNNGHCSTTQHPHYLPFSAGPRRCLGEPLAKANLFIVFSNLIHRFRFKAPPDLPRPSLEGICGLTLSPAPFRVVVNRRF